MGRGLGRGGSGTIRLRSVWIWDTRQRYWHPQTGDLAYSEYQWKEKNNDVPTLHVKTKSLGNIGILHCYFNEIVTFLRSLPAALDKVIFNPDVSMI